MGEAARRFAKPGAARRAADILEEVARPVCQLLLRKLRISIDSATDKPKQYDKEMFFRPQHLHFTGIGGIGMSGIAEVLLNLGYQISGSRPEALADHRTAGRHGGDVFTKATRRRILRARARWWSSSAVDEQNPEVQEARRLQIPVIPRGELLAELMRLKYGIAVAGSHGKTTTTSMAATILNYAGLDPTVVVGGRVGTMGGSNARVGRSDFLVVEVGRERRLSFLKLAPIIAVVTNIDREHLDHYPSLDAIRAAFIEFVNKVPFYGAVIVCLDDPNVQSILPAIRAAPSPTAPPRRPTCEAQRGLRSLRSATSASAIATTTWAAFTCASPGATTCSTPWRRSPSPWNWK